MSSITILQNVEVDNDEEGHQVGEWFSEVDGIEFGAVKDRIEKIMRDNNLLLDMNTVVSNILIPNQ